MKAKPIDHKAKHLFFHTLIPMENTKKTRGRQKLKLKFIEDDKSRIVTLTKRRTGVYKKASELCILTGVDIAILITTLSGKNFSFAHPNNEFVETQFSQKTILQKGILEPYREVHIKELAEQLEEVYNDMKLEEQRASTLKEMRDCRADNMWEVSMDDLRPNEAQKVKERLRELQAQIISIQNEQYLLHATSDVAETCAPNPTM
ncbi:putative transcription factor MADS-type1 family [Helianthus anomalus]